MSVTNHAVGTGTLYSSGMKISSISTRRCICKIPWPNEISKLERNFRAEVCAKAKNLAFVLQWIERSKQPARWRTSSIQNQLRDKIFPIMKNWTWWWQQNSNVSTILRIWTTKLPSVEPWQDKRAKKTHTERKSEECFQRKTLGSCSRRDACSFLHRHATGDREDNVGWSGETQEILT